MCIVRQNYLALRTFCFTFHSTEGKTEHFQLIQPSFFFKKKWFFFFLTSAYIQRQLEENYFSVCYLSMIAEAGCPPLIVAWPPHATTRLPRTKAVATTGGLWCKLLLLLVKCDSLDPWIQCKCDEVHTEAHLKVRPCKYLRAMAGELATHQGP